MTGIEKRKSKRRDILKGVGAGTLGLPLLTGTATAKQGSLRVEVEAGEGSVDNWQPRDVLTDNFKAKIDVSGLSTGASDLAVMVIPVNPDGAFVDGGMRASHTQVDWSSGSVVPKNDWTPGGPIMGWPNGTYRLYAAASESGRGVFGTAVSAPFEIET